jgi:hypothetical protein
VVRRIRYEYGHTIDSYPEARIGRFIMNVISPPKLINVSEENCLPVEMVTSFATSTRSGLPMNATGLDKIILRTSEFDVRKNADLDVVRSTVDNVTGEELYPGVLWRNGFIPVKGRKAYNNNHPGISITITPGRLKIVFNPNVIIFGDNLRTVNYDQFLESIDIVDDSLNQVGISTNIENCKLSRVDLCRDIEVDHSFELYQAAFQMVSPKYMSRKNSTFLDGYFRIQNSARQYCYYHKQGA